MAQVANITPEDSINDNLEHWCYEVGTHYEEFSKESAKRFIAYIKKQSVIDLGCGDGAATKVFIKNGNPTTAVDINPEKLNKITGATLVNKDFLTYLTKPVDNIFCHHALEHFVDYQQVLDRIGKYLKKGKYCYIAVPKNDKPHSVHHVAFESIDELLPPGLTLIDSGESDNKTWPEYWLIARQS